MSQAITSGIGQLAGDIGESGWIAGFAVKIGGNGLWKGIS